MYKIMHEGLCYEKDLETIELARAEARKYLLSVLAEDGDEGPVAIFDQETNTPVEELSLEVSLTITPSPPHC